VLLNVGRFLITSFLLWLVIGLGTWSAGVGFGVSMLLGSLPTLVWTLYLQHQRRQRVFNIEAQLPDTLDLMARAMQAGHAFSSALLIVGSEGTHPIREEFQATFDEINFGITTEVALKHLTLRVASSDLRFFVVAVLIQLETGGNLTEILKSLASLIRDRQRIAGSVRVLTAEGRLSAWILGLLPFGIAMLLSMINPEFISKLWTDPMGIRMLQVSLALMAIGIWWMWRMVRIRI
jgi:tight adherence protein B